MTESAGGVKLTREEVAEVLQAIRDGRVVTLDDVPYNESEWDEEAVRDWLERTHLPTRARQIVSTLRGGRNIKSRPVAPTVSIALHALMERISQLEREVTELRQRVPSDHPVS